ncbi:MAG: hypothetical protein E7631_05415 [Ruminococcaceae bacterium]|nr:hypothetical protein [Oscillospiraceae bacterium]
MRHFRKWLCTGILLVLVYILAAGASAQQVIDSGTCGTGKNSITWAVIENNKVYSLLFSGSGSMEDYYIDGLSGTTAPWAAYRNSVTKVGIGEGITHIGDNAFATFANLKVVSLPTDLLTIGDYAFHQCSALKSLTLPASLTSIGNGAFLDCTDLASVEFPDTLTKIGGNAFGHTKITSLVFPASLTYIGDSAFQICFSLTSAYFLGDAPTMGGTNVFKATSEDFTIYYDASTTDWTTPEWNGYPAYPVTGDCGANGSITWSIDGTTLTFSGSGNMVDYFSGDISGTSAPWGWYGSSIEKVVFYDNLGRLGITRIGDHAFDTFTNLKEVSLPTDLLTIGDYAFDNCEALTSIVLPDSLKTIGNGAFCFCRALTDINFPDSLETIGANAFNTTDLTEITFPDSLTSIGASAFYNTEFTNLVFPASITSIGNSAFLLCTSLTSARFYGDAPTMGTDVFKATSEDFTIYYDASTTDWTTPEWNGYPAYPVTGDCGTNGSITWSIDGTTLTFSGSGSMEDYFSGNISGTSAPWGWYGSSIEKVVFYDNLGRLGITHIGDHAFDTFTNLKEVSLPTDLLTIGDYAFDNCEALTSIVLPDSLTSIGNGTFCFCRALTDINFPDSLETIGANAFNTTNLTEITFPDSLTSIGASAFYNTEFTNLVFPASLTSIGNSAFLLCTSLTSARFFGDAPTMGTDVFKATSEDFTIYYDASTTDWTTPEWNGYPAYPFTIIARGTCGADGDNLTWVLDDTGTLTISGEGAMKDYSSNSNGGSTVPWNDYRYEISEVVFAGTVTSIGDLAFYDCSGLTQIVLPDSLSSIGDYAFSSCYGLTQIVLPDSLSSIGDAAFADCYGLTQIVLPDSLSSIGDSAFYNCNGLTQIILPDSLSSIGDSAFYNCNGLAQIVLPDSLSSIGDSAFNGCYGLTQIVLPDSLSSIGDSAFSDCYGLTQIVLPDSLSSIGNDAFYDCSGLTQIVLPDSLSSIGDYAFYYCSGLTDIVFPDSLSSIGNKAFYDCSKLTKAYFNGNAPEMGSDVFAYTHEDFTIYYNPNTTGWSSPEWNGYPAYPYGDTNCDTEITDTDALYLLRHTLLPERYPLRGAWFDFNNDGIVNFRDAVYLLYHVLMPDEYPLYR